MTDKTKDDLVKRLRAPASPSETTAQWRLRHEAADALSRHPPSLPEGMTMRRGNRPSEMLIPNGQTCGDCAHFKRCSEVLGIVNGKETLCNWDPNRFIAIATERPKEEGMSKEDGGPAGMTLRDYFAAAALPALIATDDADPPLIWCVLAGHAYEVADAMLKARDA